MYRNFHSICVRAPGEPLLDYMHKLPEELRACLLSDAKIKENSMCSKIEKLEEELEVGLLFYVTQF